MKGALDKESGDLRLDLVWSLICCAALSNAFPSLGLCV